jgi:hypothetical protein
MLDDLNEMVRDIPANEPDDEFVRLRHANRASDVGRLLRHPTADYRIKPCALCGAIHATTTVTRLTTATDHDSDGATYVGSLIAIPSA